MDIIQIKHFKKSFANKLVHKDINLSIKKGECLGLIGGSGAGKSVILKSMIGLIKPDQGTVIVDNTDITQFSEEELIQIRKNVAYVFQNGALFDSMTVFDNLAYPLREHSTYSEDKIKKIILDQLDEFGLSGNENTMPAALSGGMQKRVGLARSIIMNPDIILYDEPTAGLDPYNTLKIQEMILRLKERGTTSVFVTHDMPSAKNVCDRLALLVDGEIRETGTFESMENQPDSLLKKFIQGEAQ